jgi:diguanylate cyclase
MNPSGKFNAKYGIYSLGSVILVFSVLTLLLWGYLNNVKQQEEILATRRFLTVASLASNEVIDKQLLLKGYLAYIETTELTEADTINYLQHLIADKDDLIRNVTIIEDTTIKWIYPKETNQQAIGIDLATVPTQKDIILKIKNERVEIIHGPVDLVQGGQGIIIRMPVIKSSGAYYGQLSIVLDLEKLAEKIQSIAEENELRLHITSKQNGKTIVDNLEVLDQNPMLFSIRESGLDWNVHIVLKEGWKNIRVLRNVLFIASILLALLIGIVLYFLLMTNEKLHYLANNDPLTGLYNRRFLEDYQSIILVRSERYDNLVGIMLLDLDGFKSINDNYGHKAGDAVLVRTAGILREQTRLNESIFRLGGDEFLIVFPDLQSESELSMVLSRILVEFEKPMKIQNTLIKIKPSIGIATYPIDGTSFEQVLHKADQRMYENKPQK